MSVRVRFAPSPTGPLHVGGLRTALFNVLFAEHHGGRAALRIEDTDIDRSSPAFEARQIEALTWAGVHFDEGPHTGGPYGPYRQSERRAGYDAALAVLKARGRAYPCYVSPAELELMRAAQRARGEPPRYDNRHRGLTAAQIAAFEAEGRAPAWRLRGGDGKVAFDDLVRGRVEIDLADTGGDPVLVRADGVPTWLFAGAVDDAAQAITHVLRGDDHLANTARQIDLFAALDAPAPRYGHMPMIVGADGKPLSKRDGDTDVLAFRDAGFLPAALTNLLLLTGWSPPVGAGEVLDAAAMARAFDGTRIHAHPAVFDRDKLAWFNARHAAALDEAQLARAVAPFVGERSADDPRLGRAAALTRGEWRTFVEARTAVEPLLMPPPVRAAADADRPALVAARDAAWASGAELVAALKAAGFSGKALFMPVRRALTGTDHGPPLGDVIDLMGPARVRERIHAALESTP